MIAIGAKLSTLTIWALVPAFLFSTDVALAGHCTVSKIAIVAGPWGSDSGKTSYTVQAQDSAGTACHVSETLRLSFASSGTGTFTSESGSPVQAWISSNSANRNFYYQTVAGAGHTLTIQAGYGSADSWSVLWQTTHNTSVSLIVEEEETDESGTATTTGTGAGAQTTEQGGTTITHAENTKTTPASKSSTLARPRAFEDDPLKLVLTHPKRVSAGQPVLFVATPSGLEDEELRTLRYLWSFGDSSTSTARTPTHVYKHPGTYVVIGMASRAGHEIAIRTEVTVLPLDIMLSRNTAGDLLIENNASYEIEISRLVVSDGRERFTIPDYTYLLPNASIALPLARTGFSRGWSVAFAYDRGNILLAQYPTPELHPEPNADGNGADGDNEQTTVSVEQVGIVEIPTPTETVFDDTGASVGSVSRADAGSATTTILAVKKGTETHSGQVAAAVAHSGLETKKESEQSASPRWTIPFAFVGVVLVGILALYVHKIV